MENTNDNHSGHIPCWTEPMGPETVDNYCDISGGASALLRSAIGHLAERRVWNAVLKDETAMADLLEDYGNLSLLMSAIVRDLARR